MKQLVVDIETVGEDFDALDGTTQEALTWWIKKESESEQEYEVQLAELKNGLGFSPLTGQIVAIGVLDVLLNQGAVYYQSPGKKEEDFEDDGIRFRALSEKEMLEKFWEGVKNYHQIVTFNGRSFDIPFIMIRSAVCGVRCSPNLMPPRFDRMTNHIDLLEQLTFFGSLRKKGNLHLWSRVFGIQSPKDSGITGEDVGRLYREGKFRDIAQYNVGDLRATRELYLRWESFLKF